MRKMALDLGNVRIGIAFSDVMGIIASAYETYTRKSVNADVDYVLSLYEQKQADALIIGLPVNMDGTEGERAVLSREFADKIRERADIEIVFIDERLTTVTAERVLISADVRREKRKQVIDKVAAAIILQAYLDRKN